MSQKPGYGENTINSDYIKKPRLLCMAKNTIKLSKNTNDKMGKIFAIYFPSVINKQPLKTQNVQQPKRTKRA